MESESSAILKDLRFGFWFGCVGGIIYWSRWRTKFWRGGHVMEAYQSMRVLIGCSKVYTVPGSIETLIIICALDDRSANIIHESNTLAGVSEDLVWFMKHLLSQPSNLHFHPLNLLSKHPISSRNFREGATPINTTRLGSRSLNIPITAQFLDSYVTPLIKPCPRLTKMLLVTTKCR